MTFNIIHPCLCEPFSIILKLLIFIGLIESAALQNVRAAETDIDLLASKWSRLSVDSLISMGNRYAASPIKPDSALLCFSIAEAKEKAKIMNRPSSNLIEAYLGKARVALNSQQNYREAYDNFRTALYLCKNESKLKKYESSIISGLAGVCQTLYELTDDRNFYEEAYSHYSTAIKQAFFDGRYLEYDLDYLNLLSLCYVANDIHRLEPEIINFYNTHADYRGDLTREFNQSLQKGFYALDAGNASEAIAAFKEQLRILPETAQYARYRYLSLACLGIAYEKGKELENAIATGKEALDVCLKFKLTDGEVDAVKFLSETYEKNGNTELAASWRTRQLALQDSLLSFSESEALDNIRFHYDLKKTTQRLQRAEIEKRRLLIGMISAVIVMAFITILLWIIFRKNKKLNDANSKLYEEYEAKLSSMSQKVSVYKKVSPTPPNSDNDELYTRIKEFAIKSPHIFDLDFSLTSFAASCGISPVKISQSIKMHDGINFPSFINQIRIAEACRKLRDQKNYGHLTIEAIAQSIGFKSRTSFIAAFKKETGLTPSDYLKEALVMKKKDSSIKNDA